METLVKTGLILLLVTGCSSPPSRWQSTSIVRSEAASTRHVFSPENPFRELELEIVHGSYGTRVYLNGHSEPFPTIRPNEVEVTIIDEEGVLQYVFARRLRGGQRLQLSEHAAEYILSQLNAGKTLTIAAGRYKTEVLGHSSF